MRPSLLERKFRRHLMENKMSSTYIVGRRYFGAKISVKRRKFGKLLIEKYAILSRNMGTFSLIEYVIINEKKPSPSSKYIIVNLQC